jgi:uncharacterized protein (DUF1810 family)
MQTSTSDDLRDPFDLGRFLHAQERSYTDAIAELRDGEKRTHWMWFVFPQLRGLGYSDRAQFYGIGSLEEAREYCADPILGQRLRECMDALLQQPADSAEQIFGSIDSLKLHSCLTLFRIAVPGEPLFGRVLAKFFGGRLDDQTIKLLERARQQ